MKNSKKETIGRRQIEYLHKGNSGDLLFFLHGFGVPPNHYERMLELLSRTREVVAPKIYAMNSLPAPPTTIDEYAELTLEFAHRIAEGGSSHFTGHSIGATVAIASASKSKDISDVVAINPAVQVYYGPISFGIRAVYKDFMEVLGVEGEQNSTGFGLKIPLPFLANMLRNPKASYAVIKSLTSLEYGFEVAQPVLILYGEEDEYFDLNDSNLAQLKKAAPEARIVRLSNRNHDWPIFSPQEAASRIEAFVNNYDIGGR